MDSVTIVAKNKQNKTVTLPVRLKAIATNPSLQKYDKTILLELADILEPLFPVSWQVLTK